MANLLDYSALTGDAPFQPTAPQTGAPSSFVVASPDELLAAAGASTPAPSPPEVEAPKPRVAADGSTPKMPTIKVRPEDLDMCIGHTYDLFTPWYKGKDPVTEGFRPKNSTGIVDPLTSYVGEGVKAVNLFGNMYTRDQIAKVDGGRSLLYYQDKLASGDQRSAADALGETIFERKWTRFVPYINSIAEIGGSIATAARAGKAFEKMQRGEEVSLEDMVAAQAVHVRSQWEATGSTGAMVADIALDLPALCVGFNLTGKASSAAMKGLGKISSKVKPHIILQGSTKFVGRDTARYFTRTAANAIKSTDTTLVSKTATELAQKLTSSLGDDAAEGAFAATLKKMSEGNLAVFATEKGLTPAGLDLVKTSMRKAMTATHVNSKIFASTQQPAAKKLFGLVAKGSAEEFEAGMRAFAKTAESSGKAAGWADDVIEQTIKAFNAGDFTAINKGLTSLVNESAKATATGGTLGTAATDAITKYVDQYVDVTLSKPGVKSWFANKLLRARDAAFTALNDEGIALMGDGSAFVSHSVRGNLAHALGIMTVEAPIRGAVHTGLGLAGRTLFGSVFTAGEGNRAMGRNELVLKEASFYGGDEDLMENAFWIGLGMDYAENVSESVGEAFSSVAHAAAKTKPMQGLHKYLKAWIQPSLEDAARIGGDALAKDRQAGMFLRRMVSRFVDGDASWTQHYNSQVSAIYRALKHSDDAFSKAMSSAGKQVDIKALRELAEKQGIKDTTQFVATQLFSDTGTRKAALDAAKKYMSAKAIVAMRARDIAAKISSRSPRSLGWVGQLFSPTGRRALGLSTQWSGMVQEWCEERYGGMLSGFFGWDTKTKFDEGQGAGWGPGGIWQRVKNACGGFLPDSDEQFWSEVIAFSIPGVMGSTVQRAQMMVADGPLSRATNTFERLDTIVNNAAHSVINTGSEAEAQALAERINRENRERRGNAEAGDVASVSGTEVSVQLSTPGQIFQGTNAQKPAEQAEVDAIVDEVVNVALTDANIYRKTRGTLLNNGASRVAYKALGMINFMLTGNFNAVRMDPYMSIARNWVSAGDILRQTRLDVIKWEREAVAQALQQIQPGATALADSNVVDILARRAASGPEGLSRQNAASLLTDVLTDLSKEQRAQVTDMVYKYVREKLQETVRATIASRGLLRLSHGSELDAAATRAIRASLGKEIETQLTADTRDKTQPLTVVLPDSLGGGAVIVDGSVTDLDSLAEYLTRTDSQMVSKVRQDIMARFLENTVQGNLYFNDASRLQYTLGEDNGKSTFLGHGFSNYVMTLDAAREGKAAIYTRALDVAVAGLLSPRADVDVIIPYDNVDESAADVLAAAGFSVPQDTLHTLGSIYRAARDHAPKTGAPYLETLTRLIKRAVSTQEGDDAAENDLQKQLRDWGFSEAAAKNITCASLKQMVFDFADRAGMFIGADLTPVVSTLLRNAAELEAFSDADPSRRTDNGFADSKFWRHATLSRDTTGQKVKKPIFRLSNDGQTLEAEVALYAEDGTALGEITIPFSKSVSEQDSNVVEWYATKDVAKVVAAVYDYKVNPTLISEAIKEFEAAEALPEEARSTEQQKAPLLLGSIMSSLFYERATRDVVFSPVSYINVTDARIAVSLLGPRGTHKEFEEHPLIKALKAKGVTVGFNHALGETRAEPDEDIVINLSNGQKILNALDEAEKLASTLPEASSSEDLFNLKVEGVDAPIFTGLTRGQLEALADTAKAVRTAAEEVASRYVRLTGATQNGRTIFPINVMALSSESHFVIPFDAARTSDIGTAVALEGMRLRARYAASGALTSRVLGGMVQLVNPVSLVNKLHLYTANLARRLTDNTTGKGTNTAGVAQAHMLERLLRGPLVMRHGAMGFDELAPMMTYLVLGYGARAYNGKSQLSEDAAWGVLSHELISDTSAAAREIRQDLAALTVLTVNPMLGFDVNDGGYTQASFNEGWKNATRVLESLTARDDAGRLCVEPNSFWGVSIDESDLQAQGDKTVALRLEETQKALVKAQNERIKVDEEYQAISEQQQAAEAAVVETQEKIEKAQKEPDANAGADVEALKKKAAELEEKLQELNTQSAAKYRELVAAAADENEAVAQINQLNPTSGYVAFEKVVHNALEAKAEASKSEKEPTVTVGDSAMDDSGFLTAEELASALREEAAVRSNEAGGNVEDVVETDPDEVMDDPLLSNSERDPAPVERNAVAVKSAVTKLTPKAVYLVLEAVNPSGGTITRETLQATRGGAAAFAALPDSDIALLNLYNDLFNEAITPEGRALLTAAKYPKEEPTEDAQGKTLWGLIRRLDSDYGITDVVNTLRNIAEGQPEEGETQEESESAGSAEQEDGGHAFNDVNNEFLKSDAAKALSFLISQVCLIPGGAHGVVFNSLAAVARGLTEKGELKGDAKNLVDRLNSWCHHKADHLILSGQEGLFSATNLKALGEQITGESDAETFARTFLRFLGSNRLSSESRSDFLLLLRSNVQTGGLTVNLFGDNPITTGQEKFAPRNLFSHPAAILREAHAQLKTENLAAPKEDRFLNVAKSCPTLVKILTAADTDAERTQAFDQAAKALEYALIDNGQVIDISDENLYGLCQKLFYYGSGEWKLAEGKGQTGQAKDSLASNTANLLSQLSAKYVAQFDTGIRSVRKGGQVKGVPLLVSISPRQREAAQMLLAVAGQKDPKNLRELRWDNDTPMFYTVLNEPRDLATIREKLIGSFKRSLRADTQLAFFPLFTGDRGTPTMVGIRQSVLNVLITDITKGNESARELFNKVHTDSSSADRAYALVYARLLKAFSYDGATPKRTAMISSNTPTIPLAAGEHGKTLMAVLLTGGEGKGEGDFGNAYLYLGKHAANDTVHHSVFKSAGVTTKVHVVYRESREALNKLGIPTRGGFVKANYELIHPKMLSRYGVGTDKALRAEALQKLADKWAGEDAYSLVAADLDSHKVSFMDLKGIEVIQYPDGTADPTSGEVRPVSTTKYNSVKEFLRTFRGATKELTTDQLRAYEVKIGDRVVNLTELFPGARVVPTIVEGEKVVQHAFVYEVKGAEAVRAASLGRAPQAYDHEEPVNLPHDAATAARLIKSAYQGTLAGDLASAYYEIDSLMYSIMSKVVTGDGTLEDMVRRDPELAAAYELAKGSPGLAEDLRLRLSSKMAKAIRPKALTLKSTLVSCGEKGEYDDEGNYVPTDGRRDKVNAFYVRDELYNAKTGKVTLGWARANIDTRSKDGRSVARYGLFVKATDEITSVEALRGKLMEIERLQAGVRKAKASDKASKRAGLNEKVNALFVDHTGGAPTWFNEYTSLTDLFAAGKNGEGEKDRSIWASEYEADPIVAVTGKTAPTCYAGKETEISNVTFYIPGSILTFPRTPSQNMGPQFITLRLSAPVAFNGDSTIARESLIMPPPGAAYQLGADYDGDTTTLLFTTRRIRGRAFIAPGTEDTLSSFNGILARLRKVDEVLNDPDTNWKEGLKDIVRSGEEGKYKYSISEGLQADMAAVFASWYQTLGLIRRKHLGYSGWAVGVSNLLDKEKLAPTSAPSGYDRYHKKDANGNPDLTDLDTALFVMFSGVAAQKARGAAVAAMGGILAAAQTAFIPGVLHTRERNALRNLDIKRFVEMVRIGDGLANALFDDLKEQISFLFRITPETTDTLFGMIMHELWLTDKTSAEEMDAIAQDVIEKFLTMIDGAIFIKGGNKERKSLSGVFGDAFAFTSGLKVVKPEADKDFKEFRDDLSRLEDGRLKDIYGVAGALPVLLKSSFLQRCAYAVDRATDERMKENMEEKFRTLLRGAVLMHQCRSITPLVRPQKMSTKSPEYVNLNSRFGQLYDFGGMTVIVPKGLSVIDEETGKVKRSVLNKLAESLGSFPGGDEVTKLRMLSAHTSIFNLMASRIPGALPVNLEGDELFTLSESEVEDTVDAGEAPEASKPEAQNETSENSNVVTLEEAYEWEEGYISDDFGDEITMEDGVEDQGVVASQAYKTVVAAKGVFIKGDEEAGGNTTEKTICLVPAGATFHTHPLNGPSTREHLREQLQRIPYACGLLRMLEAPAKGSFELLGDVGGQKFTAAESKTESKSEKFLVGVDTILSLLRKASNAGTLDVKDETKWAFDLIAQTMSVGVGDARAFPAPRSTGEDAAMFTNTLRDAVKYFLTTEDADVDKKLADLNYKVVVEDRALGGKIESEVSVADQEDVGGGITLRGAVLALLLANVMSSRTPYDPKNTSLSVVTLLPFEYQRELHSRAGMFVGNPPSEAKIYAFTPHRRFINNSGVVVQTKTPYVPVFDYTRGIVDAAQDPMVTDAKNRLTESTPKEKTSTKKTSTKKAVAAPTMEKADSKVEAALANAYLRELETLGSLFVDKDGKLVTTFHHVTSGESPRWLARVGSTPVTMVEVAFSHVDETGLAADKPKPLYAAVTGLELRLSQDHVDASWSNGSLRDALTEQVAQVVRNALEPSWPQLDGETLDEYLTRSGNPLVELTPMTNEDGTRGFAVKYQLPVRNVPNFYDAGLLTFHGTIRDGLRTLLETKTNAEGKAAGAAMSKALDAMTLSSSNDAALTSLNVEGQELKQEKNKLEAAIKSTEKETEPVKPQAPKASEATVTPVTPVAQATPAAKTAPKAKDPAVSTLNSASEAVNLAINNFIDRTLIPGLVAAPLREKRTVEQVKAEIEATRQKIVNKAGDAEAAAYEYAREATRKIAPLLSAASNGYNFTEQELDDIAADAAARFSAAYAWHRSNPAVREIVGRDGRVKKVVGYKTPANELYASSLDIAEFFALGLARQKDSLQNYIAGTLHSLSKRANDARQHIFNMLINLKPLSKTYDDKSVLLQAAFACGALGMLNYTLNDINPNATAYNFNWGDIATSGNYERGIKTHRFAHDIAYGFTPSDDHPTAPTDFKPFGAAFLTVDNTTGDTTYDAEGIRYLCLEVASTFRSLVSSYREMKNRKVKLHEGAEALLEIADNYRFSPDASKGDAVPAGALASIIEQMLLTPIASALGFKARNGAALASFYANPEFKPKTYTDKVTISPLTPEKATAAFLSSEEAWKRIWDARNQTNLSALVSLIEEIRDIERRYNKLSTLVAQVTGYGNTKDALPKDLTWGQIAEMAAQGKFDKTAAYENLAVKQVGPQAVTSEEDPATEETQEDRKKAIDTWTEVIRNQGLEGVGLTPGDEFAELPVDDVTSTLYFYDPASAFDHFVAPRYGRYNLRESVLFSSGEDVVTELHELQRFLGNMFGTSDPHGRVSKVEVAPAEAVKFEKGMFRVTSHVDGKVEVIRFRENSEAAIITSALGKNVADYLTNSDRLEIDMFLKAAASEILGGTDAVYTSVGSARRYSLDFLIQRTDFGEANGTGGIRRSRNAFMERFSRSALAARADTAAKFSNFDSFMLGLYEALPDDLADDIARKILDHVWTVGDALIDAGLSDDVCNLTITENATKALVSAGLLARSSFAKTEKTGAPVVTVVVPTADIYRRFEASDTHKKLVACGRKAEWLQPEALKARIAPVIRKINLFLANNPALTEGDLAGLTGFDSFLWLTGKDGMFKRSGAAARKTMYSKDANFDETLMKNAARFGESLAAYGTSRKMVKPAKQKSDDGVVKYVFTHGVTGGLLAIYLDKCVRSSDPTVRDAAEKAANRKTVFTEEELDLLGFTPESTYEETASRVYDALTRELYTKNVNDIILPAVEGHEDEKLPHTALAFIRGYEMADTPGHHVGMTIKDAFDLQGALPDDQNLIGMISGLAQRILNACSFTGTIHNMLATLSEEGMPNYLLCPSEAPVRGEIISDEMWAELAHWYIRIFKKFDNVAFQGAASNPDFQYKSHLSGRQNCRAIVSLLRHQDFYKSKYADMENSANVNYADALLGVEHLGCFVPNRPNVKGKPQDEDFSTADDTHSAMAGWHVKNSEAYGMMCKILGLRASTKPATLLGKSFDWINSWSKSANVAWSWFFQIATVFESQVAASGFMNTVLGLTKSGANLKRKIKSADSLQDGSSRLRKALGGQTLDERNAEDPDAGLDNLCALSWADIAEMWNTDHPYLVQLKQFCSAIGVTMTRPDEYVAYFDQNGKMAAKYTDRMADTVAGWWSALSRNEDEDTRTKNAGRLSSFFRGVFNTNHSIDAFTRLMDITKMAVVSQLCSKLRAQAVMQGMYFDPIRVMRKIGNYINEEIGGINPLAHAFDTPTARKWMSRMLFSWTWTMGSWSAGGGTVLSNALLGGDATTDVYRAHMWGRWLRMGAWVMYGVPIMIQIISNAMAKLLYAAAGTDDDEEMDMNWMMWNNEEKLRHNADITPLLHALMKADEKICGPEHGVRMAKLGKYGGLARATASLLPMYTGANSTGRRRYGIHWGKQAHEITGGWAMHPVETLVGKISRPGQVILEEVFGWTADPAFPAKHLADHEEGVDRFRWGNSFVKSALGLTLPFSASAFESDSYLKETGALVSAVAPVNVGMSKMVAMERVKQELRHAAERSQAWAGPANLRRTRVRIASILRDAARNGYDPEAILTDSKKTVISEYYRDLFNSLPKYDGGPADEASLQRAGRALRFLGAKKGGAKQSMRNRLKNANIKFEADDPTKIRIDEMMDSLLGSPESMDGYRRGGLSTIEVPLKGDSRMAAKAGASTMGDKVPETVFGMPVSVSQRGEFDEYPEAAGLYRMSQGRDLYMGPMPRSVFGMRVESGTETTHSTRPYAGGNDAVPQSIFGMQVITRGMDGADRIRSKREGSFFDPREKLAIDDTPATVFGIPVKYEAHKIFAQMPNSAGFYQLGSVAKNAMRRHMAPATVFGMPVSMEIEPQDI